MAPVPRNGKARLAAVAPATVRCAIYTRKSTDEGLDRDFNSLDNQREAGENYIRSQRHEGWEILPDRYDDGGFSGGNADRPALNRLLADFCGHVQTTFHQQVPSWFNRLISEVGTFDPASMLFRYADAGAASRQLQARGEFWVDLRVLREKMERVQRGFHSVINRQS